MRRVLVLRPEPGASATIAKARAMGLEPIAVPLFTIEPVEWAAPDPTGFDGLCFGGCGTLRGRRFRFGDCKSGTLRH